MNMVIMKNIFNKYIIIVLSFYAFWVLGIPLVFSHLIPKVCENVSQNSDFMIEIKKPQIFLSPLPVAKFTAESISVKNKQEDDYTNINNFETSVRILPLLSGSIHLNTIKADEIYANSVLKKELELDKDFFSDFHKAKIKCDEISVKKLTVNINEKNVAEPVNYFAENIYFKNSARALKFNLKSRLTIKDSVSNANINLYLPQNNSIKKSIVNIAVENFDIATLGDYLRQYLPNDLKKIRGIINIQVDKQNLSASFENCAIIMKDNAKSMIFPNKLDLKSRFNVTNKVLGFDSIDIKSENINATISGYVLNYLNKSTTSMNLNVRLNQSRVEDIVEFLPPIIVEEFNVYKLKQYKFYGDVIGNFSIKGDVIEPEINGDVFVNNGVLIKPIKNANGATIKLDFTGKYVNFDVYVPAGGAEKVWVKGGVELYNIKYSDMRIWSTKSVDLQTAEEKVVPLHEILNFIIGPVPIMDIKGNGNIDITVKGNRKNPHVWGVLNVKDVTTHFNEIPDLVLTNADAILSFNDQNAEFKTFKGLVNKTPIAIAGVCNLYGKFDFDVNSNSQEIGYLYKAIQTSTMIEDAKKMLPQLDIAQGLTNLKLKVYGSIIDINDIRFNENLFAKGEVELLGNLFGQQGIKVDNTKGNIKFDGTNAVADIKTNLGSSVIAVIAVIKDNLADLKIDIPKLNLKDILPLPSDIGNIFVNVSASYKGNIDTIEYNKINFIARIFDTSAKSKLKLSNGSVALNNGRLKISDLNGWIINSDGAFTVNIDANNIFSKPNVNGLIQLKSFDLTLLNEIGKYSFMPDILQNIEFQRGKLNFNFKINNNKMNGYSDLGGFMLMYKPLELPVKIVNGSFMIRNNSLRLNKLNLLADGMPILLDGVVNDIFKKQSFDVYVNSKPKQEFIDKYINKNQLYPVKIKGDIVYTLKAKGTKDNFDIKTEVNMAPDSSIYHLGATVGDIENAIVLNLDAQIIKQNIVKIKEFSYDKIISSLAGRQTRLNMLKAKGGIEVFKDDLEFHDLYIKTQNPTDARIFNIIFRKPNIKQGQFTSDLRFNGRLSEPKLLGDFHIFETNIPFLDTTMKNITFKFKEKTIDMYSKGEILNNDVVVKAVLKNKLTTPYYVEKADFYTKVLDLNYTIDKMKRSQLDNAQAFDSLEGIALSSIVIKSSSLNADSIHLRNIIAKDFKAETSFRNDTVNVEDFKFSIANGVLNGKFKYNLANNDAALDVKAKDINANDLAYALFDLNNQIYGDLTGDIKLSCNGSTFENCLKTLNGKTVFNVADGKMPKLGSLEYLLKAGNLVKGGLTSISINSVIDIITPLKTGDFSSIYGVINIQNGIADDIEIATRGKDLSLFITGKYDFGESNAEMEVLGLLSRKISTMFGPLGNFSLNTLFNAIPGIDLSKNTKLISKINRIPGIELSNKSFRKFIAEIRGNINGDDYVTSFKWIN